ncbi:MAG: hypothetical protein H9847_02495 [Candidatus Anaerobiospirillum pullicola]|uniref:Cell division protein ZipA n=1 Tax=Candidatus Anaerobiospirillum pullicola TaxID=2838451 RepID=A0A948TF43_9GAMM|nr:hypothetical protein [Candidatus Anaerobiospirillum pullicola]
MSSFSDPSSIVLIVGAICILVFIVHGLWFSNKPQNRRLKKNDQRDQELSRSNQIGKVRIVTPDSLTPHAHAEEQAESEAAPAAKSARHARATLPHDFDDGFADLSSNASISVNPQTHGLRHEAGNAPAHATTAATPAAMAGQGAPTTVATPSDTTTLSADAYSNETNSAASNADNMPHREVYEIIIAADKDKPYLGEDIEELCNHYGFIQGFIKDNLKIYFVYENAREKTNEVFRICSMEPPFYFPENMHGYQTSAIALYMTLPERGKAFAYFNALRMATEIFIKQLGGHMEDQQRRIIGADELNALALELQNYDNIPAGQQQ